jgi:hypothetical protein
LVFSLSLADFLTDLPERVAFVGSDRIWSASSEIKDRGGGWNASSEIKDQDDETMTNVGGSEEILDELLLLTPLFHFQLKVLLLRLAHHHMEVVPWADLQQLMTIHEELTLPHSTDASFLSNHRCQLGDGMTSDAGLGSSRQISSYSL